MIKLTYVFFKKIWTQLTYINLQTVDHINKAPYRKVFLSILITNKLIGIVLQLVEKYIMIKRF